MTNLLEPKAVQWKKSCLVSKGNKNGEFSVSSSAQAGKLAADSTRGSWNRSVLINGCFLVGLDVPGSE